MKRTATLIVLLFIVSIAYSQSFYGSQYFVGTKVNDSITSTPISDPGPGGCYPSAAYTVTFPISKITGIKNYMLIDAVSSGNSVYTTQIGNVHTGDTLVFSSQYPSYDFYFPTGGGVVYTIRAIGTPTKAGESYSCGQFIEATDASGCPDIISYTFIQTAKVQVTNGIVSPQVFKIVPLVNLAPSFSKTTSVTIDVSVTLKDARFELYDISGRKAASQPINDRNFTIDRNGMADGNYFWKVINNNATIGLGKIVITH
jgi:hypothetical protein